MNDYVTVNILNEYFLFKYYNLIKKSYFLKY